MIVLYFIVAIFNFFVLIDAEIEGAKFELEYLYLDKRTEYRFIFKRVIEYIPENLMIAVMWPYRLIQFFV
jgi:hypothetical protein